MANTRILCCVVVIAACHPACRAHKGSGQNTPAGVEGGALPGDTGSAPDVSGDDRSPGDAAGDESASTGPEGGSANEVAADVTTDPGGVPCGGTACKATEVCLTFSGSGGPRLCSPLTDGGGCAEGSVYTNACLNQPGAGCLPAPPPPRCAPAPVGCPLDKPDCTCAPQDVCQLQSYTCSSVSGRTVSCFHRAQ